MEVRLNQTANNKQLTANTRCRLLATVSILKGLAMRDFRQIKVWGKAHSLTLEIYKATSSFPREELYSLTSQLRRASASIAANIAEGFGRGSNVERARFLQIGMGSAYEAEYHALLAKDLGFIKGESYDQLEAQIVEVKRMLAALLVKVRAER